MRLTEKSRIRISANQNVGRPMPITGIAPIRWSRMPLGLLAAMKAVDQAKALGVIKNAFDFLGTDPRVKATTRAVIGWCFGGGWSLALSLVEPVDATVIYYGRCTQSAAELRSSWLRAIRMATPRRFSMIARRNIVGIAHSSPSRRSAAVSSGTRIS